MTKSVTKREQLPEQQSTENEARAGTHDHVRQEPLHSVSLWSLTTACVSSPGGRVQTFQVAQGQCLCLIATLSLGRSPKLNRRPTCLPNRASSRLLQRPRDFGRSLPPRRILRWTLFSLSFRPCSSLSSTIALAVVLSTKMRKLSSYHKSRPSATIANPSAAALTRA